MIRRILPKAKIRQVKAEENNLNIEFRTLPNGEIVAVKKREGK